MTDDVKFYDDGLKDLIAELQRGYFVRVGIIGSKAGKTEHKDSHLTNAELGTIHEFGSKDGKHPPRRSFLEDSLKFKLKFNEEQLADLRKSLFKNFFEKKMAKQFLTELGAKCLQIIEQGFATNGFGMWKPLSTPVFTKRLEKAMKNYNRIEHKMETGKMAYDKALLNQYFNEVMNPQILTDTGKLRKSFSFQVMRKK